MSRYDRPTAEDRRAITWIAVLGTAVLVVILGFSTACHAVSSYFEARSYNRLTGSEVTTWDAMFVDLRVQAPPIGKE